MAFGSVSAGCTLKLQPYKVDVEPIAVQDLQTLLKLSRLGPSTYENSADARFGVTMEWMSKAKQHWEGAGFDWNKQQAHINSFPHFTTNVEGFNIHFVALFSQKRDAIPLICLHGWPGSFLEWLRVLQLLTSKYSPETLPYHIIVPSLPGYGFSSPPPQDRDFGIAEVAGIMHQLMTGLGFDRYASQGGDIGAKVARILGAKQDSCKAVHLNDSFLTPGFGPSALTVVEQNGRERASEFLRSGAAYAFMHGTRPATIGFVLSSNPLALLAWIGEKLLQWTDEDPPLDTILTLVSLFWFTNTISTSVYPYREQIPEGLETAEDPQYAIRKPFGFSYFAKEIAPAPKSWVAKTGDLCFFRKHTKGGHFAALEQPAVLLKDVEDFLAQEWREG